MHLDGRKYDQLGMHTKSSKNASIKVITYELVTHKSPLCAINAINGTAAISIPRGKKWKSPKKKARNHSNWDAISWCLSGADHCTHINRASLFALNQRHRLRHACIDVMPIGLLAFAFVPVGSRLASSSSSSSQISLLSHTWKTNDPMQFKRTHECPKKERTQWNVPLTIESCLCALFVCGTSLSLPWHRRCFAVVFFLLHFPSDWHLMDPMTFPTPMCKNKRWVHADMAAIIVGRTIARHSMKNGAIKPRIRRVRGSY